MSDRNPFDTALYETLRELHRTVGTAIDYIEGGETLAALGTLAGTFQEDVANVTAALQLIRCQRRNNTRWS